MKVITSNNRQYEGSPSCIVSQMANLCHDGSTSNFEYMAGVKNRVLEQYGKRISYNGELEFIWELYKIGTVKEVS